MANNDLANQQAEDSMGDDLGGEINRVKAKIEQDNSKRSPVERWVMCVCPDCQGDGKETCHNPDHGFIAAMGWHEIGRLGCPVCGHDEKHKVPNGDKCETCGGKGEVTEEDARRFCDGMEYDFELEYLEEENT